MFNYSPDKVRGGLGSRHGDDSPAGGVGHGLGMANPHHHPQHQQEQQQPQAQYQQHGQFQQPQPHHAASQSGFAFVPSRPEHNDPTMRSFSADVTRDGTMHQAPGSGADMMMEDANESEANVSNLIAHFENRSRKPTKTAHSLLGATPSPFNRTPSHLRVTSPGADQFTPSMRVRTGSIGRPPPVRFGSMGHHGPSGLRISSPTTAQSVDAYGNRSAGLNSPRVAGNPTSPLGTMPHSLNMPTPMRRQASNISMAGSSHAGNIPAGMFSNMDAMSPSAGDFDGGASPFSFVNSTNMHGGHGMDSFAAMSGSVASPILETPTSPFGGLDFSAQRVVSPIQSPPIDPYAQLGSLGGNLDTDMASSYGAVSPGERVTSPADHRATGAFRHMGSNARQPTRFVASHTNAFQNLDPFNSMSTPTHEQNAPAQFHDLTSPGSTDVFGDLGSFIKQEPSADTPRFDGINPVPRSDSVSMHSPMHFAGQGYFQSQPHPPQPPPQRQPSQSSQPPQRQSPPVPPAKKPFLSRHRQSSSSTTSTPGFNIWKPPVPNTPKPAISHNHQSSSASASSAMPSVPPFPSSSRSDLKIRTDQFLSPHDNQQRSLDTEGISSPANLMQPNVTSPVPQTPSVTSPNPPPLPVRPKQTGSRYYSREQVPAEAWESVKSIIRQLYLEERKPLKEVIQVMSERHGFQATPKMYKTRFSQWGFVKNNTEEEVKKLLSMKFQRDAKGKVTEFVRNGRVINLGTYLKRKGVTEYDLVDFDTPADLPSYVRCRTPTPPPAPGYLRSPDLLRAQETVVGNMRKAFLHCRQAELDAKVSVGWTSITLWGAASSELLYEASRQVENGASGQGVELIEAFKQLEVDLGKLSPQGIKEILLGMVHRDPGMMTALSKYLAAYSTTNYERSHPLRQVFTTLYEVQQKHGPNTLSDLVWGCIPTIADELESIYGRRHPYVARTWIDLAMFYNHANAERLENLLAELPPLMRAVEAREGADSAEAFSMRYTVVQLVHAADPSSEAARAEASTLWETLKESGRAFLTRSSDGNTYCVHDPVKVTPWVRRCRERYAVLADLLERHVGVKCAFYFEEDMHSAEHVPDSRDAWAAAMQISMGGARPVI